ncbi:hypothetical protein RD110_13300 [Rhodoferax koreense]|uniref:DUF6314 domain-containing protein n=1 Tax=Rhodoferax koreensis TaxID=1842727 RepID=A0A1P8JWD9_9BURK|nr:DUF6314 family protein [Rhodoferax koreense]APW38048.1 hypothetical protein RD110_13300 [Rhodoferax koreense]
MSMTAHRLLELLRQVRSLDFTARSESDTGWNGRGSGNVEIESPLPDIVLFHESGQWQAEGQPGRVAFRNVYRWSVVDALTVRLEHLRLGRDQPVFLLDLAAGSDGIWQAAVPHLCVDDRYALRLTAEPAGLRAVWTIHGPKKQETLDYAYTF